MLKERNENAEMTEIRGKICSVLPFDFRFPHSCSRLTKLREDPKELKEMAGEVTEEASWLMSTFDTYTPFTIDGTGMQIIIKGKLPTRQWQHENITIYSGTGQLKLSAIMLPGPRFKIEQRQNEIDRLFAKYPFVNIWQEDARIVVNGANNKSYDSPISGEAQVGHHASLNEANDTPHHAPISEANDSDHAPISARFADEPDTPVTEAQPSEEEKVIDEVFELPVSYLNWIKAEKSTSTSSCPSAKSSKSWPATCSTPPTSRSTPTFSSTTQAMRPSCTVPNYSSKATSPLAEPPSRSSPRSSPKPKSKRPLLPMRMRASTSAKSPAERAYLGIPNRPSLLT